MSIDDLDPVLYAPKRLAVMAILASSTSAEFRYLRDHLGVSDSDLSKQMAILSDAGHVKASKTGRGPGGVTWYQATKTGIRAFKKHRSALTAIIGSDEKAPVP